MPRPSGTQSRIADGLGPVRVGTPSESNPLECVSVNVVSVADKYRPDHITQERMPSERPRVGIWADSNPCQGGQGSGPEISRCEAVRLLPAHTYIRASPPFPLKDLQLCSARDSWPVIPLDGIYAPRYPAVWSEYRPQHKTCGLLPLL